MSLFKKYPQKPNNNYRKDYELVDDDDDQIEKEYDELADDDDQIEEEYEESTSLRRKELEGKELTEKSNDDQQIKENGKEEEQDPNVTNRPDEFEFVKDEIYGFNKLSDPSMINAYNVPDPDQYNLSAIQEKTYVYKSVLYRAKGHYLSPASLAKLRKNFPEITLQGQLSMIPRLLRTLVKEYYFLKIHMIF